MNKYTYKARDRQGQAVSGTLEIETQAEAVATLREQGFYVTQIKAVPKSTYSQLSLFQSKRPIKIKLLAIMCRQFAIQLEAGLSLVECLKMLEEQAGEKHIAETLNEIRLDVASGTAFTDAVEKHRDVFPHEFIHLIEAGEIAGELPAVFNQLASYYEREDELNKKVSEALMYPAIIGIVAVIMVFILIFFVLPMLINNFSSFGIKPPLLTQMILDFRDLLVEYWYLVFLGIAVVVFALRWYARTDHGRLLIDRLKLILPVIGNLNKMVIFSRFCRIMGLLLGSGISMVKSLEIMERLISNRIISEAFRESRIAVEKGQGLTDPLRNNKVFPVMLVQMVAVGEESGNLETTLGHLSSFYDREVNFAVTAFTKVLEPAVMLVLAGVVFLILISVYMPMMDMIGQIQM